MDIVNFTPGHALVGGALIGLASSLCLMMAGRVAGISGILGGLRLARPQDVRWRVAFLTGLAVGGVVAALLVPESLTFGLDRSLFVMVVAGILVGFGSRLGSGCTSGHGVCGLSRLSLRSLVATLTFMFFGALTVALMEFFTRGGS